MFTSPTNHNMQFKKSLAINGAALVVSSTLVGISIASIYFAGNADEIIKHYFPPGFYRWVMSRGNEYFNVGLEYNRSSEIKTLISSALTLVVGLSGVFASGLLHKVSRLSSRFNRNISMTIYADNRPASKPAKASDIALGQRNLCLCCDHCLRFMGCGRRSQHQTRHLLVQRRRHPQPHLHMFD